MTDRTRSRRRHAGLTIVRIGGWLTAGVLAAVATLGPAARPALGAVTVTPIDSGNPSCAAFAPAGSTWSELRLAEAQLADGTYNDGTLSVTISDYVGSSSGAPGSFDWAANIGVDAVFVKAGSVRHNLYTYDPEATSGAGLRPQAGKGNGISHISFCYDAGAPVADDEPTDEPTDDPTEQPTEQPLTLLVVEPTDGPTKAPADSSAHAPGGGPEVDTPSAPSPSASPAAAVLGDRTQPAVAEPSATPHVGAVLAATSAPSITPPPTDTLAPMDVEHDGWRVILAGLALLVVALLLAPARERRRR